ncbi:MAG: cobalt-precorrin 5A hydrolase, partial [Rhodospirillaceae bacterium]
MNSSFRFESDPVFVCLTASGAETAQRLRRALGRNYAQIHGRTGRVPEALADQTFSETIPHLQDLFRAGRPIIGLCAAGILIRALAPLLADKHSEPAVLSVSEDSQVVVPLLGGHHGANRLAEQLAQASGGVAALTTAGDRSLGLALDEPPAGWRVADPTPAKALAAALLAGETVSITRPEGIALDWPPAGSLPEAEDSPQRLVITERSVTEEEAGAEAGDALTLHPPVLALGIGCERDCPADQVAALVANTLAETGYSADAVACVVSIDLKSDETAILAQAAQMGVPARFFDAATLEVETPRLQTPSDVVFREVGCHGVAEGAALAAVGPEGTLVVAKRKAARCTVALARAATVLDPSQIGRARGQLFVV